MMILEEAKKPGIDFTELARRYSEDNKTWVNGIVGWVPRGSMPSDYWEKALTMKKGEIDGPVRSYKGFHIIKVNDIRVAERNLDAPEEVERLKSRIAQIHNDTLNAIYESYLESVKEQFEMKINREAIELIKEKLGSKINYQNVNTLITLQPGEKELYIVEDNLGGMKIRELMDLYSNDHLTPTLGSVQGSNNNVVEQIFIHRYLNELTRKEGFFDDPEVLDEGKKALENIMLPVVEQEIIFNLSYSRPMHE